MSEPNDGVGPDGQAIYPVDYVEGMQVRIEKLESENNYLKWVLGRIRGWSTLASVESECVLATNGVDDNDRAES